MYNRMYETEVFVCGGGPAGLAAAIAGRMAGFEVTVADFAQAPIDKVCGEGLMPEGLSALARLGVKLSPSEGHAFEGIRFSDPAGETSGKFTSGHGLGLRRPVLHKAMIDRAVELGVSMLWGVRVSALSSNGVTVNGRSIRARWVVCADGQHSKLRDLAGLSAGTSEPRRFGFRRHYRIEPWSNLVEVYWTDLGQMYITPVGHDEINVAFLTRRTGLRLNEVLPHFPEIRDRLAGAGFTRVKGAVTATRKLRAIQRNRIALIGDASGSVDPVTGEGLALAFQQAMELADAMQRDDLAVYEAAHRRISRLPHVMAELLLAMDAHPNLRHRVFRAFSTDQNLFQQIIEVHTGALSPMQFGVRGSLLLGWRLLTA